MSTVKEKTVVAIVDDDESVREAVSALIQSDGIPTLAFVSAEGFLNSSQVKRVGCLVADIRMPGMSGLELQSKLNEDRYDVPIIFITAHGNEKVRMQALRSGAVEFLVKPFDDDALLESVRAALNS
jgi:FixJ family two-component response regulator